MECVVRGRRIKYEDNELWYYYSHTRRIPIENPRWLKFKQSNSISRGQCYKVITIKDKKYKVHRVIYKIYNPEWDIEDISTINQIDHIDINSLNNNIENLRVATQQQNMWNKNCKGYSFDKKNNKWRVRISVDGKSINGGYFNTEEEAIKKRAELKNQYHNF